MQRKISGQKRPRDEQENQPESKRKRRKRKDPSYTLNSEKGAGANNPRGLFNIRGVDCKDQIIHGEQTIPKKTSVMYNEELFPNRSPATLNKIKKSLSHAAAKSKTHRPVKRVVERSHRGTPRKIATPGGTTLTIRKNYNAFRIFTNHSPLQRSPLKPIVNTINDEEKKADIQNALAFKRVKPNKGKTLFQEIRMTPELIRKANAEIKKHHGVRYPSQGLVMSTDKQPVSANQYGKLFIDPKALEDLQFEFIHFLCYHSLGPAAQHDENLGVASYHANTDMLFVEVRHEELSKIYPEGFDIKPDQHFVEGIDGNQLLTQLDYYVEGPGFKWKFMFDCQTSVAPDIAADSYMGALVVTQKKLKNNSFTPSPSAGAGAGAGPGPQSPNLIMFKKADSFNGKNLASSFDAAADDLPLQRKQKIYGKGT